MIKLKSFIETHALGMMTLVTGVLYVATLVGSVWFIRDYCRISKAVKEIYRVQREVHPFNHW